MATGPASPDRSTPGLTGRRDRNARLPSPITVTKDGRVVGTDAISQILEGRRPENIAAKKSQTAESTRRQQLLRSAGYRIVVDGVWGPRSQKAWVDYKNKLNKTPLAFGPRIPETRAGQRALPVAERLSQPTNRVTPEEIEQARRVNRQNVRAEAMRRIAHDKAQVLIRGRKIQVDPGVAKNMTLRQVTEAVIDPQTKLNPVRSKAGAAAVQVWLNAHGYPTKTTGEYDRATYDNLRRAEKDASRKQQVLAAQRLRHRVYHLLSDVRPGDKPSWWTFDEPIPTPAKLIAQLQSGSFTASLMLNKLMTQAFTGMAAFNQIRHSQMLKLATEVAPFGTVQMAKLLKDPRAVSNGALLIDLLGVDNMAPMGDFSELPQWMQADAMDRWSQNPEIRAENAKRVGRLRAEVHALSTATDAKDYQEKLIAYGRLAELQFTRTQKALAEESTPWWGKTLGWVMDKSNWYYTALVYDGMRGAQLYDNLVSGGDGMRAVQWEDAAITMGYADPEDYAGTYDDPGAGSASIGLRLGLELTADPINFFHPFRLASTALKYSTKGGSLGAYSLRGGLWEADNFILKARHDVVGGLMYTRGSWKRGEVFDNLTGGVFKDAPHRQLRAKAVASKDAAMAAARERIRWAARHNHRAVELKDGSQVIKVKQPNAKTRKILSDSRESVISMILSAPELNRLLTALRDGKISIYVDKSRRYYSNVGSMIWANMGEKGRLAMGTRHAVDRGWEAYDRAVDEWLGLNPLPADVGVDPADFIDLVRNAYTKEDRANIDRLIGDNEDLRDWVINFDLQTDVFNGVGYKEYLDIFNSAGNYLKGGAADRELQELTGFGASHSLDQWELVILPAMQDILEREADAAFDGAKLAHSAAGAAGRASEPPVHALWDQADLWAGRSTEQSTLMRELAHETFLNEKPVANPQHGFGHTAGEASELQNAEIRRRIPRAMGYAARNFAGGTLPDGFDLSAILNDIERDVKSAWTRHEDGLYYDDRAEVMVSELYARNQAAVGEMAKTWFANGRQGRFQSQMPWATELGGLAGPTAFVSQSPIDEALWRFSWIMGNRFKALPGGLQPDIAGKRFTIRGDVPDGLTGKPAAEWMAAENARQQQMYDVVSRSHNALIHAQDNITPWELNKQGAIMRAFAHAQSWPLRYAYLGLKGVMQAWVFATLPLRPGWMVRNVIDNAAKLMVSGVYDPRMYFVGAAKPGALVGSVFDLGLRPIREMITYLDKLFGTNALDYWKTIERSFWEAGSDVLRNVFKAHGIEVDEAVLKESMLDPFLPSPGTIDSSRFFDVETALQYDDFVSKRQMNLYKRRLRAKELGVSLGELPDPFWTRWRDGAWDLMGNRPESYFKRVLYRDKVMKATQRMRTEPTERAKFLRRDLVPQEVWVDVDEAGLRELSEKVLGKDIAKNLRFEITYVSRQQYQELHGRAWAWRVTNEGKTKANPHPVIQIFVPIPGDTIKITREQTQVISDYISYVILHEIRHVQQSNHPLFRKIFNWDRKRPYQNRIVEIDARFWGRFMQKKGIAGNVVTATDEAGQFFPTELDEAAIAIAAHREAWEAVEKTLFDYSNLSVTEDNLRVFFPFIQFWRKNTAFWATSFASKPWLLNAVITLDKYRREAHKDLPQWQQRYMHIDEVTDAVAFVPGLDKVVGALIPNDVMYDPVNLLSFSPFYRTYKKEFFGVNEGLMPSEDKGWAFIGPMLDGLADWGLGPAPWVRKPLESLDVASDRSWQTAFPQTGVAVALTREWFGENLAGKVADWERVFTLAMGDKPSDQIMENFTFNVQAEVAGQVARGETPDWDKAANTIKAWFYTQNVFGYFTGMYLRRATSEDLMLSKLMDDLMTGNRPKESFTDSEWNLIKLWGMRGMDRLTYQKYIDLVPLIESYYKADDWQTKVAIKRDHPEVIRWVDATWNGRPFKSKWTRNAQKYVETEQFMMATRLIEAIDPPAAVANQAIEVFKTPELVAFWRKNDSTAEEKERHVRGAIFEYFHELNNQYHNIPEDDFEAKHGFIQAHPEMVRHWNRNNDPVDDFDAIVHSSNAAAREMYFDVVKRYGSNSEAGFNAAAPLLKAIPWMFEDTKSAKKVDERTGEWITGMNSDGTWKDHWDPARSAAFRRAKPHLNWFFDTYLPKVGEKAAWAWLESSSGEKAMIIKDYLRQYAKKSAKSIAYLKARRWLALYFDMPVEERTKWLRGNSDGAKIVRWYFQNYAGEHGLTQHAQDYLAVKSDLNFYFSLPKQDRRSWLAGGSESAQAVLGYFKKYGKNHKQERAWKRLGKFVGGTPEQQKRLDFWRGFYALPPDQRPSYVYAHAEAAGIFIYGEFGEQEQHDREQEYLRHAVGAGASKRQAAYMYAKPLLDFYFSLPESERPLFARANPEVQGYLDKYGKHELTGDPKLDALVESYFKLPPSSLARSEFLRMHPDVQDWFDDRGSPAEAAMRNVLEQYFALRVDQREQFAQQHPEIPAYFEQRRLEKAAANELADAFDQTDPRVRPFFLDAQELEGQAAHVRDRLKRSAINALAADEFSSRRSRNATR